MRLDCATSQWPRAVSAHDLRREHSECKDDGSQRLERAHVNRIVATHVQADIEMHGAAQEFERARAHLSGITNLSIVLSRALLDKPEASYFRKNRIGT